MNYRITKYDPYKRDRNGKYDENEWTSLSDLINEMQFNKAIDIYLKVENKFIELYSYILSESNIEKMIISSLEINNNYDKEYLDRITYNVDINILKTLKNGKTIDKAEILGVIRLSLREIIWCKLNWNLVYIHFGYDYYTYIGGITIANGLINSALENAIYIEEYDSPYLSI